MSSREDMRKQLEALHDRKPYDDEAQRIYAARVKEQIQTSLGLANALKDAWNYYLRGIPRG